MELFAGNAHVISVVRAERFLLVIALNVLRKIQRGYPLSIVARCFLGEMYGGKSQGYPVDSPDVAAPSEPFQ